MSNTINLEFISCKERKPDKSGIYAVIKTPIAIGEAIWDSSANAWFDENDVHNRLTGITHWAEKPNASSVIEPYSPEWLYEKMRECCNMQDQEYGHICADELLCETLQAKGYEDAVELFGNMPKWYS